jgi:hypothetical protein
VEARTPGGQRRSDVEVVMSGGHRLAIELQRRELSDAEWIAVTRTMPGPRSPICGFIIRIHECPGSCSGIASQDGVST